MPGGYKGPITQHQEYAITGKVDFSQTFGVEPHDRPRNLMGGRAKGWLKDGQRGHGNSKGYHEEPDHGEF